MKTLNVCFCLLFSLLLVFARTRPISPMPAASAALIAPIVVADECYFDADGNMVCVADPQPWGCAEGTVCE